MTERGWEVEQDPSENETSKTSFQFTGFEARQCERR